MGSAAGRVRRRVVGRAHAAIDGSVVPGSLDGQVAVVTGADSGPGLVATTGLARLGAQVELVVLSRPRGEQAADRVRREVPDADLAVRVADVADLGAVRDLADQLLGAHRRLDLVVHNAGALLERRTSTALGIEMTLATMVVGPFLLSRLLEDRQRATDGSATVWVSASGRYLQPVELDDLQFEHRPWNGPRAYAQAGRAQIDVVREWAERRPPTPAVHALHPGSADTLLWLATSPSARSRTGTCWFDRRPRTAVGLARSRTSAEDRARLWDAIERLAGEPG